MAVRTGLQRTTSRALMVVSWDDHVDREDSTVGGHAPIHARRRKRPAKDAHDGASFAARTGGCYKGGRGVKQQTWPFSSKRTLQTSCMRALKRWRARCTRDLAPARLI